MFCSEDLANMGLSDLKAGWGNGRQNGPSTDDVFPQTFRVEFFFVKGKVNIFENDRAGLHSYFYINDFQLFSDCEEHCLPGTRQ